LAGIVGEGSPYKNRGPSTGSDMTQKTGKGASFVK